MKKKPELTMFSNGDWVIVGDHLSLEDAQKQFGDEYRDENDLTEEMAGIESVKHWWIRYEFIGPDNCPDGYDEIIDPGDALWILKEQEKRPKGCIRKVTVINEW